MSKTKSNDLTEVVKSVLAYDASTGIFVWKTQVGPKKAGSVAGTKNHHGYVVICINGKLYQAHRLAWLLQTGSLPREYIDHVNGNRGDNRWCNLRECNAAENNENTTVKSHNRVGFLGVSKNTNCATYSANIRYLGKHYYLGSYSTPEEAHEAYKTAKRKLHRFQPEVRK